MARSNIIIAASLLCAGAAAADAGEKRQLGAHQHGHGTLNLAVDGNTVSLELEVPGTDIVGFEHEATSPKDKAELAKAIAALNHPLTLFEFPDAGGCTAKTTGVKFEIEDHTGNGGGDDAAKPDADGGKSGHDGEAHHAAFHAEYILECKSPAGLKSLSFPYFSAFTNAQGLTIEVITPKGQTKFEATRDKSVIDLSSLM